MDGLRQAIHDRILILDGAMGTMLQRHGLSGNSEPFNLSHPDIVRSIHRAYIDAGADIVAVESAETDFCSYEYLTSLLNDIRNKYPEVAIMADLIAPETGLKLARDGLVDILSLADGNVITE